MSAITTCTWCGQAFSEEHANEPEYLCRACRWPCFGCGKPYPQHADKPRADGVQPRMPCLGLKSGYAPRRLETAPVRPTAAAVGGMPCTWAAVPGTAACASCEHYRAALRAIVDGARRGAPGGGLGDLAELALRGVQP